MLARDNTGITDITTASIMASVEPINEISNSKFNIIIIISKLTVCAVALKDLFLMVTGILVVESVLLITGILICGYYCWQRRKKNKSI